MLRDHVESWTLLKDTHLLLDLSFRVFLPVALVTYFVGFYQQYVHRAPINTVLRVVFTILVFTIFLWFTGVQYSSRVWTPIIMMTTSSIFNLQMDIIFYSKLPLYFSPLVSLVALLQRRYYLLGIPVALSYHFLWSAQGSTKLRLENAWDAIDPLAEATLIASLAELVFFATVIVAFFVWLFYEYRRRKLDAVRK